MKKPTQLSWIVCPVACSDPSHEIRISVDSAGKIRTIATDCDANDLDVSNALGTACCARIRADMQAFIRTTDYDARSRFSSAIAAALQCPESIKRAIYSSMSDARDQCMQRPKRAAISAEYEPRYRPNGMDMRQKVNAFDRALQRMPEFTEIGQFAIERSWEGGACYARLTVTGVDVATIYSREGAVSQAVVRPLSSFAVTVLTTQRLAGKRKTTICRLCDCPNGRDHVKKPEHAVLLRKLACNLLTRLGFEVKS